MQAAGNRNSGCCKYVVRYLLQKNPQDPDSDIRVARNENQERRGAHVHAPVNPIISASYVMESNPNDC